VNAVWNEVTARDPWNREAHLQMLGYLSPEECGSSIQVLDFVEGQRSVMPAAAPAVGVELAATIERHQRNLAGGGINALLTRYWWQEPAAASVLERSLIRWTQPGFLRHATALADLNVLAYALVQANRLPDAAKVFRMTGRTVTPWPWNMDGDPVQQYGHWQRRVLR
jgi:hypothetical protein